MSGKNSEYCEDVRVEEHVSKAIVAKLLTQVQK